MQAISSVNLTRVINLSYNANIPVSSDLTVASQAQIRGNFQAINQAFSNNHAALTGNNSQGQHIVMTMQPQTADPTTLATQTALYNKLVTSVPNLFWRPQTNATPIQLTYPSISTGTAATQYSFVAGPFVIYGGLISAATNGQLVTLSPATTLIYVGLTVANVTPTNLNINAAVATNVAAASFRIAFDVTASTTHDIYYLAVGK